MAKDIPIFERQVGNISTPFIQPSNRQVQALQGAASMFAGMAEDSFRKQEQVNQQILRNQELKFLNRSRAAINDTYMSNPNDPEALRQSYAAMKKGFLEDVSDPNLREELSFKFDTQTQSFLNSATANFYSITDDETREQSLLNMEILKRDGETLGGNLFSDDDLTALEAGRTFQLLLNEAGNTLDTKGLDGKPIFTADQRFSKAQDMIDSTLLTGLKNNYNRAIDQEEYVNRFINGELKFKLADEEGNVSEIEAREALGNELTQTLTNFFESDLSRKNTLRNKELKRQANIDLVDSAIAGDTFLTSESKEHRDAIDDHFAVFQQKIQTLPPEQQIMQYVEYVSNTGIYPKNLKNQMNGLIDNGDDNQKVFASQIINQISLANPQTMNQISNEQRAFARKISDSINSGVTPSNAVEFANLNVFEKDSIGYKERAKRFKDDQKAFDISLHPRSSFTIFGQDTGDEDVFRPEMIDEFNMLNRDFYMTHGMTADQAQEEAMKTISRTWNKTRIGGVERWQKFAPTAVYGEQFGEEWIEDQLTNYLIDLQKAIKVDLKTEEPSYLERVFSPIDSTIQFADFLEGKVDLNKIRLEANPFTTKGGNVGYDIYVVTDAGIDILRGKDNMPVKPFFPDITKSEEFIREQQNLERKLSKSISKRKQMKKGLEIKKSLGIKQFSKELF